MGGIACQVDVGALAKTLTAVMTVSDTAQE